MNQSAGSSTDTKSLALRLVLMTVGMFAFAFLVLPPMYEAFCDITGLGGRTNDAAMLNTETQNVVTDRIIDLQFDTTVNQYAPWEFESDLDSMDINPGGIYEAKFSARNLTDRTMIAQAVPSVSPAEAARYFKKLDCFCFTSQEFLPKEDRDLSVRFIVDSDIPDYIDTITLSYTFFDTARVSDNSDAGNHDSHSTQ
jgi:cytochrome c oxidase assembly protein subunit 11